MATNGGNGWSTKAIALARARPLVLSIVALLLGMLIGSALRGGSGDTDKLRAELTLASDATAAAEQENGELAAANSGLAAEVDELTQDVSSLQQELEILLSQQPLPSLVGLTIGEARSSARDNDWELDVTKEVSSEVPGTVLSQSPEAGTIVLPGDSVKLVVAKVAPPPPEPEAPEVEEPADEGTGAGCTEGYSPCLPPASDYDCAGGSGDGPKYTGRVTVTGSDPYGLDSDGDGVGCE